MPQFEFKAKTEQGEIKRGLVKGVTRQKAAESLAERGLIPVYLVEKKKGLETILGIQMIWENVNQKDLLAFFRQLSILISASVPIFQSLRAIAIQSENITLRTISRELAESVKEGMSLSEAMAKYPRTFPVLVVNLTRSGEISGSLPEALSNIAKNIEKNYQLNSKIKGAIQYPAFVISAAFIFSFIVISFVFPKLTQVIEDLGVDIPWYTALVIGIGKFMESYWWAVLIVIIGGIVGFFYYIQTEVGKREWNQVKIHLPLFGKIFRYIYISRFANNFSSLLRSGVSIVKALEISSDTIGNDIYKGIVLRSVDHVKTGGSLSEVLARSSEIPSVAARMVKIGEETGKLEESMDLVAKFYDEEIEYMTKNFTTLLEPVLITVVGIGVMILVVAVIVPLYSVVDKF